MNTHDLFRLDGKTALVTGGAGIYGIHITRALAEVGAQVLVASRNLEHVRKSGGRNAGGRFKGFGRTAGFRFK